MNDETMFLLLTFSMLNKGSACAFATHAGDFENGICFSSEG